jgi:hypothetical protein
VNRAGEHFLASTALPQDQDGHIPLCRPTGASDGDTDAAAIPGNVFEPFDVLRALAAEELELGIGITQDLRDKIDNQIERDLADPGSSLVGLIEGSWVVLALAQEQPDGSHRRRAGAQMDAQLLAFYSGQANDGRQFGIHDAEDLRIVDRIVDLDGVQHRRAANPAPVQPVAHAAMAGQQVHFIEMLLIEKALERPCLAHQGRRWVQARKHFALLIGR